MLTEIMDYLAGLKMTILSAVFLVIAVICMIFNIDLIINPAWGAVIISGLPLVYLAIERLIFQKWVSSALLISIAMIASLLIGEVFAAGEVAWIMALGALLEDWTVERAKKGLKNLIDLTPQTARLLNGDIIDADEVKLGDKLRIHPGENIPVDGEIISGNSSINQSIMTGESLPIDKSIGDEVYCGTTNMFGSIDIKATSVSKDSSLQKLIDLVKAADENQAPTQRIADKWATWLVPVALIIAISAWILTGEIERAVTVLVVFCPCALILATPTAIMAAIGQATKHGVLIKSGEALETLGGLNTLVFDKTGTLTYGNLVVCDVIPFGISKNELLSLTSSCEILSEHPLARAIVNKTKDENIEFRQADNFKMYPGLGVSGEIDNKKLYVGNLKFLNKNAFNKDLSQHLDRLKKEGKATVIVAFDSEIIGIIALCDMIREDAGVMINALHDLKTKTVLLSGDNTQTADYFAAQIGIGEVHGNLLPEEKLEWISKFQNGGQKVCMVGDGVNDAPALKASDVSVAMGSMGSDIAIEAADIALLGDDISKIPYLRKLSKSTLFTIKVNIALSMAINAVAIICSVLGLLNPITGAIVHNAGSCLVVLNAALLYDRHFDKNIKENLNHNHYHTHEDGLHTHSHDDVEIIDEIITENGVKHLHVHKHKLNRMSCENYHI